MAFTMCSSQAIISKAGLNANSTIVASGAYIEQLSNQAESYINSEAGVNFTDVYSSLNADTKYILEQTASDYAATYLIAYDLDGYTKATGQTMLDLLTDRVKSSITLLRNKNTSDFIVGA